MAEDGKNRMRGVRRHARKDLDDLGGSVSEDDLRWAADRLDSLIHGFEAEIDEARQVKEDDLLEV
jgi:ribosome recycling factor